MSSRAPTDGEIVRLDHYETEMGTELTNFIRYQMVYLSFLMGMIFAFTRFTHHACFQVSLFLIGLMLLYPIVGLPAYDEMRQLDRKGLKTVYRVGHYGLVALNVAAIIAFLPALKEGCY